MERGRGRSKLAWHFVNQFLLECLALYAISELHFIMEIEKFHKATLAEGEKENVVKKFLGLPYGCNNYFYITVACFNSNSCI